MPILKFEGVGFGYPGQALILSKVNFSINHGDRVMVLGANGSGKSTLALLAARILSPNSGLIKYFPINGSNLRTGIVFQNCRQQLIGSTVAEDLAFGLTVLNESSSKIKGKVQNYLKNFQLYEKQHLNSEQLSHGELRRLALAAVLITEPELLILDEPLAMLDSYNKAVFLYCLECSVPKSTTVLWLDQDLRNVRYADQYYGLASRQLKSLDLKILNERAYLNQAGLEPAPLQFVEWQFPELVSKAILGPDRVQINDYQS